VIIVSGHMRVAPGRRGALLASSRDAMIKARAAPGCRDFVVAPDPIELDRVNIYEEWDTASDLASFRGEGPTQELVGDIVHAEVSRHHVASSGAA
jgi:quinol monooxygenase YgiN